MRFKISLLFVTLTVAILLAGGWVVRHLVAAELATATTETLRRAASAAALTMDVALEARQRDMTALASAIGASSLLTASDQAPLQNWLAAYKQAGFIWLAVVDPQGRVVASTGQALEGDNMSTAVWFQRGLQGHYTSDQHALTWPAAGLADGVPWGVLMATPLPPLSAPATAPVADSPNAGVLVAMLGDVWRKELRDTLVQMQPTMAGTDQPSLWLRTRTGTPLTQRDQTLAPPVEPGQCGLRSGWQCTATSPARTNFAGLGWQATLQLPETAVTAGMVAFDRQLVLTGALSALALALAGWWLAGRISRPVGAMADVADRMANGERQLTLTDGPHVTGQLGLSLTRLLTSLRQNEAEWVHTQLALETRVEERNRELEKAVTELQEANTDLDRFASMVSHDLLAPVRAMRTFSELLLMDYADQLPPEAKRLLTRVDQAGQDMSNLVNALHALSKLGHKPLQVVPTEVQAVVAQTLHAHTPEWNTATVAVQPLPDCPCDPAMLRVVFDNLIGNAIKYSQRQAQPQIVVGGQEESDRCVYWVADNGAGFDPAYAHRLFQIFQRLHSQREYPGTGVGLATVARIVHRHGGKVWAEGAPNEGATFFFSLPKGPTTMALPVTPASA